MRLSAAAGLIGALLLLGCSTATASNPWLLHCASMPTEERPPAPLRKAALRFFPWVPEAKALHSGPVYLVALSVKTAISRDGDERDGSSYYLHRALIAVAPGYPVQLAVSGHRLGKSKRRATLGFSTNGATACTISRSNVSCGSPPLHFARTLTINSHSGWRIVQTELRIGRTGCFAVTASGGAVHEVLPLSVPGPDYGTPGW